MTKELILALTQQGKDSLQSTFDATPDDKISWKPLDNGRPALDLFGEVAQTCGMIARLVASKGEEKPSREMFGQMRAERANWTRADANAAMDTHFAALLEAIQNLSEEDFEQMVTLQMGGGLTAPLSGWAMMAYRSMISRFGQINYIQTLYGDFDGH